jgi:hypothetical protein
MAPVAAPGDYIIRPRTPALNETTLPEPIPYYLATKDKTIVNRIMTDMMIKIIR